MSRENADLVLRGYQAFVAGDLETVGELLDPDVEWHGLEGEDSGASRETIGGILAERFEEDYKVELERCVAKGDEVLISLRATRLEKDPDDDRPLQSRRRFTIGRYCAVVSVRDQRVVRVQEYPHVRAALDALGVDEAHL
jgi:ketosteroid isomerase-like protein